MHAAARSPDVLFRRPSAVDARSGASPRAPGGSALAAASVAVALATLAGSAREAHAAGDTRALALLPEDTAAVLIVDVRRAGTTALGRTFVRLIGSRLLGAELRGHATTAGKRGDASARRPGATGKARTPTAGSAMGRAFDRAFGRRLDLYRDARLLILALPADFATTEQSILLVAGAFDRAALAATARATSMPATRYRGVDFYQAADEIAVAVLGKCAVVAPPAALRGVVDRHLSRRAPPEQRPRSALHNAALADLVRATRTGDTVRLALLVPADLRERVAARTDGHSIEAVAASVRIAGGVRGRVRLQTSSRAAAVGVDALIRAEIRDLERPTGDRGGWSAKRKLTARTRGQRVWLDIDLGAGDLRALGLPAGAAGPAGQRASERTR